MIVPARRVSLAACPLVHPDIETEAVTISRDWLRQDQPLAEARLRVVTTLQPIKSGSTATN
jgi:hypothetical protein